MNITKVFKTFWISVIISPSISDCRCFFLLGMLTKFLRKCFVKMNLFIILEDQQWFCKPCNPAWIKANKVLKKRISEFCTHMHLRAKIWPYLESTTGLLSVADLAMPTITIITIILNWTNTHLTLEAINFVQIRKFSRKVCTPTLHVVLEDNSDTKHHLGYRPSHRMYRRRSQIEARIPQSPSAPTPQNSYYTS